MILFWFALLWVFGMTCATFFFFFNFLVSVINTLGTFQVNISLKRFLEPEAERFYPSGVKAQPFTGKARLVLPPTFTLP